jgi:hypothetical protein
VTRQSGSDELDTRIASWNQDSGNESTVSIDITSFDSRAPVEQEHACRSRRDVAERFVLFRGIDAIETYPDRPLLTRPLHIHGVAVDDRHDLRIERHTNQAAYLRGPDGRAGERQQHGDTENVSHCEPVYSGKRYAVAA